MKSAPGKSVPLERSQSTPEQVHVFSQREIDAIEAALAARRPLLVCGEPGIGKSQLARAAAVDLGRAYVQHVVDSGTESRDLLWHFDAVARLADAQLKGALRETRTRCRGGMRQELAVENYLHPRALWWAFNWGSARKQAIKARQPDEPPQLPGCDPKNGCVLLIDEIDKAQTDVPNGLLEALGAGRFTPQGLTQPVMVMGEPPLVIITTNEERALPDAFIRRCLVLHLRLPDAIKKKDKLIKYLVERGKAHFENADPDLLEKAATLLVADRRKAQEK
ncbi:MAG: MoxR family ATPase, partial [Candidatus Competibacteraceae bacterium]|nr:MoxR family ATPase [Candidatus Competibacteraceae bacterium]